MARSTATHRTTYPGPTSHSEPERGVGAGRGFTRNRVREYTCRMSDVERTRVSVRETLPTTIRRSPGRTDGTSSVTRSRPRPSVRTRDAAGRRSAHVDGNPRAGRVATTAHGDRAPRCGAEVLRSKVRDVASAGSAGTRTSDTANIAASIAATAARKRPRFLTLPPPCRSGRLPVTLVAEGEV